jgi:hypothetical protein
LAENAVKKCKVEAIFNSSGTSGLSSQYYPFMEYLIIFEKGGRGRDEASFWRQSPRTSLLE